MIIRSSQITIGAPVLIPENYVPDLGVRVGVYRRIARLSDRREIDGFVAEMIDRFDPLPAEVENLLEIAIERDCREARTEKTGNRPQRRGHFTARQPFANPAGLVDLIQRNAGPLKLRPDQKILYQRNWDYAKVRLTGAAKLVHELAKIARTAKPEAKTQLPKNTPTLAKPGVARRA